MYFMRDTRKWISSNFQFSISKMHRFFKVNFLRDFLHKHIKVTIEIHTYVDVLIFQKKPRHIL